MWVNEEVLHFRRTWVERHCTNGAVSDGGKIIAVLLPAKPGRKPSADAEAVLPPALREASADAGGPGTIILTRDRGEKAPLSTRVIGHILDADPRMLSADTSNRAWEVVRILAVGVAAMALLLAFSRPLGRLYLQLFDFLR
jgi:hypothetical protein